MDIAHVDNASFIVVVPMLTSGSPPSVATASVRITV
jgi:hypothetical protein